VGVSTAIVDGQPSPDAGVSVRTHAPALPKTWVQNGVLFGDTTLRLIDWGMRSVPRSSDFSCRCVGSRYLSEIVKASLDTITPSAICNATSTEEGFNRWLRCSPPRVDPVFAREWRMHMY
jgi:hypothetical protein